MQGKNHIRFFAFSVLCLFFTSQIKPLQAQAFEVRNPSSSQNIHESDHFVVRYDNDDGVTLSSAQIQTGLNQLEGYWHFYVDSVGFTPPYDGLTPKYKVDVFVSNEGYATGSGVDDIHPTMWLSNSGFTSGDWALVHELAHCFQFCTRSFRDSRFVGWFWETHAEFMSSLYTNEVRNVAFQVNSPHLHAGSTRFRYGQWLFFEYLKDTYGIAAVNDLWNNAYKPENREYLQEEPFLVLARNMQWSQSDLNDAFGTWAMHNATRDYRRAKMLTTVFNYTNLTAERRGRVTLLDTMNLSRRRFQVPGYWAPQRWGYNLVRLYPDPGAASVRITFQGVMQTTPAITKFDAGNNLPSTVPTPHCGWRWGTVAVGADGSPRYSKLQSAAEGTLDQPVNSTDKSLWLVVLGAPEQNESLFWDQAYNSIYRYPWMVQFENAWPEGFQPGADSLPAGVHGVRHSNGSGWVASTASVEATAWVGPHARVLGTAKVQGNARIEGYATVQGNATVKDDAVVSGRAIVTENAQVNGEALVTDAAGIYGTAKIFDNAVVNHLSCITGASQISGTAVAGSVEYAPFYNRTLSGTAQALADIDLTTNLSAGIYIGGEITAPSTDNIAASRTTVPGEVTASRPFTWNETAASQPPAIASRGLMTPQWRIVNSRLTVTGIPDGTVRLRSFDAIGRILWEKQVRSVNGCAQTPVPQRARGWSHITVLTGR